jgi:gliding motility-associated-like protein
MIVVLVSFYSLGAFAQEETLNPPKLPNIITPNNDGKNDRFEIGEYSLENAPSVSIVNRYGKIVFEANRYINQWDASELEDGQYFYVIQFRDRDQTKYSGTLMVSR